MVRYLVQLRNPWGSKEWCGQWSDIHYDNDTGEWADSSAWKRYPHMRKQVDAVERGIECQSHSCSAKDNISAVAGTNTDDGRFWMSFHDFMRFFYSVTINYTSDDYHMVRISEELPDEQWGCSRLRIPKDTDVAFLSLIQMNQKFFDPEDDLPDEKGENVQVDIKKKDSVAKMMAQ